MEKELLKELKVEMEKSLEALQKEFSKVRTGRASISLLDGVRVDYYGTPTPLNQLATLSIPEPRLIAIQPWDGTIIKEIEKDEEPRIVRRADGRERVLVKVEVHDMLFW